MGIRVYIGFWVWARMNSKSLRLGGDWRAQGREDLGIGRAANEGQERVRNRNSRSRV